MEFVFNLKQKGYFRKKESNKKPDPFIDMENAIRSSWATTLPVWSESKTLKILFITTSASHLNKGSGNGETERILMAHT